jgi:hypothetical protein
MRFIDRQGKLAPEARMKFGNIRLNIMVLSLSLSALSVNPAIAQPLIFPDCVCNESNFNGLRPGDHVSVYFKSFINHLRPGTITRNIVGSCSSGFPACGMNNYRVNGGFKARVQSWAPDALGYIYPYVYKGIIVQNTLRVRRKRLLGDLH